VTSQHNQIQLDIGGGDDVKRQRKISKWYRGKRSLMRLMITISNTREWSYDVGAVAGIADTYQCLIVDDH
jgi:hypothetical protein